MSPHQFDENGNLASKGSRADQLRKSMTDLAAKKAKANELKNALKDAMLNDSEYADLTDEKEKLTANLKEVEGRLRTANAPLVKRVMDAEGDRKEESKRLEEIAHLAYSAGENLEVKLDDGKTYTPAIQVKMVPLKKGSHERSDK